MFAAADDFLGHGATRQLNLPGKRLILLCPVRPYFGIWCGAQLSLMSSTPSVGSKVFGHACCKTVLVVLATTYLDNFDAVLLKVGNLLWRVDKGLSASCSRLLETVVTPGVKLMTRSDCHDKCHTTVYLANTMLEFFDGSRYMCVLILQAETIAAE